MPSEAINSYGVTVGTATTPIVGMSADAQIAVVQNQEPAPAGDGYARAGDLFVVASQFNIAGPGTALFSVTTGDFGLQIDSYEIVSTGEVVLGQLLEGATITTTGTAIPAYNLNRQFPDTYDAVLEPATVMTGGTVISQEIATATKNAAGGGRVSTKIHTLEANTEYGFRFINQGNQTTSVFFQMTFAEKYNGFHDVWLGGSVGDGVRLRGGESIQLPMIQGQTLSAVASDDVQIAVLRQD